MICLLHAIFFLPFVWHKSFTYPTILLSIYSFRLSWRNMILHAHRLMRARRACDDLYLGSTEERDQLGNKTNGTHAFLVQCISRTSCDSCLIWILLGAACLLCNAWMTNRRQFIHAMWFVCGGNNSWHAYAAYYKTIVRAFKFLVHKSALLSRWLATSLFNLVVELRFTQAPHEATQKKICATAHSWFKNLEWIWISILLWSVGMLHTTKWFKSSDH